MRFVKKRENYLKENKDLIKDDALEILAANDDNQPSDLKKVLDKLDDAPASGKVVTRFAPSPTGFLHIGGVRTALYNYLFAKKHNGIFYIRIEDTDSKRFVEEAENYIKETLEWCGIEPDWAPWIEGSPNGPYRQSERDYSKEIKHLLDSGNAYYAFDTEVDLANARKDNAHFAYDAKSRDKMKNSLTLPKEEVESLLKTSPYVIRFKVPADTDITITDLIRGEVTINTNQVDDKVLVKSNGIPTYHMANVCDDHNMGTTHVIRGEEWLPSSPLHKLLYEAFGWDIPQFAHLPIILNPDGRGKLSKRKALSLGIPAFPFGGEGLDDKGNKVQYKGFRDEGYEPDALLNFLILLGWTPKNDKEMLHMSEMISEFSLEDVHKSGARYDIDKAKHFNQQYLNLRRDHKDLLDSIDTGNTYDYDDSDIVKILDICKSRSTFKKDMQKVADIFFHPVVLTDTQKKSLTDESKKFFEEFLKEVDSVDWKDAEAIKKKIFDICTSIGAKMGKIMPHLRTVVAGGLAGPDLISTMQILGKEEVKNRLKI